MSVIYGGLFALTGAALLTITYQLLRGAADRDSGAIVMANVSGSSSGNIAGEFSDTTVAADAGGKGLGTYDKTLPPVLRDKIDYTQRVLTQQRTAMLHHMLMESGVALGLMTLFALLAGYWLARRTLRPVRLMTLQARKISEANLHERLAVRGPRDEIKHLGDTFDRMLSRLERAFDAQRRFVANASHELRTPLTYQRTLLEVALADQNADDKTLREACEGALRAGEEQERLIHALLTLARSQRGIERSEPVDLAEIATAAVNEAGRDTEIEFVLRADPASVCGDPGLLCRLVSNLVDNAARHNEPGGWVRVSTGTYDGRLRVRVVNSGSRVPPDRIEELFQPFQRLDGRSHKRGGLGLGLSIVEAIAQAHGAEVHTRAPDAGGLDISVVFTGLSPKSGAL
jgi:signal transduction histidine kinase